MNHTRENAPRHESTTQPGLYYWAEPNGGGAGAVESYAVIAQAKGAQPVEAFDDWLANWEDANEIAAKLARGEDVA